MKVSIIKNIYIKILNNNLYKDSAWALFGNAFGKFLALFSGIIIARILGKDIFGEYGLIKNTLMYFAIFSTLGLGYTATKFIAEYLKKSTEELLSILNVIYSIAIVSSSTLALVMFFFARNIADYLDRPSLSLLIKITAFTLVFNAINTTQIGILSGFKAFKVLSRNNIITGVIIFMLSVSLTYYFGIKGAVYALLFSFAFQSFLNFFSIRKLLSGLSKHFVIIKLKSFRDSIDIIKFSLPIAIQESLYSVIQVCGVLLLVKYSSYGELGIYSASAQWASVVLFVPAVLKNVILSYLSSEVEKKSLVKQLLKINFVSTIIPFIGVLLFSKFICSFYGNTFTSLRLVLIVAVSSTIFTCMSNVFVYELISSGKTWYMFWCKFARNLFIITTTFICFAFFKVSQHALIFVIVEFISSVLFFIFLFRRYN